MKKIIIARRKAAPALLLLFLTMLFFGPCEVYAGSISDFKAYYGIGTLCFLMLLATIVCFLITFIILCLLPKGIYEICVVLIFAVSLMTYIQNMFLNGSMVKLDGDTSAFQNMKGLSLINLAIWLLVFVTLFIFWHMRKELFASVAKIVPVGLILVQLIGFVFLFFTTDFHVEQSLIIDKQNMFSVCKNRNIIVFVLDYFDNRYIPKALADNPELLDDLGGFTYYHNTTSRYSTTFPSVPYLLTGKDYLFDHWYADYLDDAFRDSENIKNMEDAGYHLRTYTEASNLGETATEVFENVKYGRPAPSYIGIAKGMLKISLYRYLPYAFKQRFFVYTGDVQKMSVKDSGYMIDDSEFYKEMLTQGLHFEEGKGEFSFYHLMGAHEPYTLGADGSDVAESTCNSQIEGCFTIINSYIDMLKEERLFENSMIIITADHGIHSKDVVMHEVNTPILFVKEMGADDSSALMENNDPMSHEVLLKWIQSAVAGDEHNAVAEDPRVFYHLEDKNPNILGVREYKVHGDANQFENWEDTGIEYKNEDNYY